jgi:hypothetical protein
VSVEAKKRRKNTHKKHASTSGDLAVLQPLLVTAADDNEMMNLQELSRVSRKGQSERASEQADGDAKRAEKNLQQCSRRRRRSVMRDVTFLF